MTTQVTQAQLQPRAFPALDGIRGIAAALVALFHLGTNYTNSDHYPAGDGYLAVDLFFVLSGFVLAHAYDERFAAGMSARQFMRLRLIRLYPLYLLGLLLGTALVAAGLGTHPKDGLHLLYWFGSEALMLPAWSGRTGHIMPLNAAAWSLFFEVLVNYAFAATWSALARRWLLFTLVVAGAIFAVSIARNGSANLGADWWSAWVGIPRTIFSFAMGVLICRLRRRGSLRLQVPMAVFALLMVALVLYLAVQVPDDMRAGYDALFVFVLSPLLVVLGTSYNINRSALPAFTFMGVTSYALYAVHVPLVSFLKAAFPGELTPASRPAALVSVAVLLALAYLLDLIYDTPVRRWLSRLGRAPSAGTRIR